MTFFSRAATFLALSAAAATVNAQDGILGGFQSGPSEGAFYASGMNYIPWKNRAFFTGLHYNEEIMPKELVQNSEMTGVSKDHASNCYLAKMDFDEESNNGFYKSMTDWMSYGNPKKIETCTAVAAKGDSDVFVVGSVEEGGIFSDGYPMQGLLSVLDKDTLEFLDATLIKSAEDPNMHMVYPLDVIHDYHRKFIYIAALTSKDAVENEITGNKWSPGNQGMPNWNEEQKLGSGFDVTVVKIHAPDGQKPTAKWVKHYPLDVEDDGTTPPVFIGGMAIQEGSNGVQHLLITGSTRGNGEAFGASAPGSVDEDGFVMQLQPSDGSLIKQERHKGDGKIVDDVREGTPKDDFIGGMCNNLGRGHETNTQGESDHFYIVGGTKGDMTSNRFGVQNADGAGLQINASFKDKYGKTLQRGESFEPFIRKIHIDTLKPVWTTQWVAAPPANTKTKIPANAYSMDCYVDVQEKAVYVVGSVLGGARMAQGDVDLINQGGDDIWVAKIHEDTGNVYWITQLGSEHGEYLAKRGSIAVNNEGNVLIYGDTHGSLYRHRGKNEKPVNTDMFVLTINGNTGAIIDDAYLGGTSSAVLESASDWDSHQISTSPPQKDQIKDENRIDVARKHGKVGVVLGIFAGVIGGLFLLYLIMMRNMKKKRAEAQKSSIFSALQQFDVEDIDLRRSPPGGWHGTYMNKLAYGQNDADVDSGTPRTVDSEGGYKDNFSIDDEDAVDARLSDSKIV